MPSALVELQAHWRDRCAARRKHPPCCCSQWENSIGCAGRIPSSALNAINRRPCRGCCYARKLMLLMGPIDGVAVGGARVGRRIPLRPTRGHADVTVGAAKVGALSDVPCGASAGIECGASFGIILMRRLARRRGVCRNTFCTMCRIACELGAECFPFSCVIQPFGQTSRQRRCAGERGESCRW